MGDLGTLPARHSTPTSLYALHMNRSSSSIQTTQPAPSPSLTHSQISQDDAASITRLAEDTAHLTVNGTAVPAAGLATPAQLPAPVAKKPKMTHRLTRMFSRTEQKDVDAAKADSIKATSPKPDAHPEGTNGHSSRPVPARTSSGDQKDKKMTILNTAKEKTKGEPPSDPTYAQYKRFELHEDGTHEHHLKSAKRQEKLSLMSSWVDQLRSEKDSLAGDKKGGPNATANLVEKYGKCQEIVGRGAFGIVRISHKPDPNSVSGESLYAVKEFRRRPQETAKKYQKRLTSEFCISSSLRHPNIIHTLDLLQDAKGDYCEVMEYCAGGDLYTLVLAAGQLQVLEADCFFKQLMRGVEYMHEMGVAHRDLKPENLLLTTHGALKITDFGNGECFRMAWEKEAHMTAGLCGSAPYIAPEEYIDKEFDARAVDVWATGVIYMAMRTGRHLWRVAKKDEDEFYERYLEGRRDEEGYAPIESLHRARCRNVIYSILDPNPSRRITASQVLKSEWGREIKVCKAGEEGY